MGSPRPGSQTARDFWRRHYAGAKRWIESQFADRGSALAAAEALTQWLNAYPADGGDILKVAYSSTVTSSTARQHEITEAFARPGLDAAAMRPLDSPGERAVAGLLALCTAEAKLEGRGPPREVESLCEFGRSLLDGLDRDEGVGALGALLLGVVEGRHLEAALEREAAARRYLAACETGAPLVRNRQAFRLAKLDWLETAFGEVTETPALAEQAEALVRRLFDAAYTRAALGAARCLREGATAAAEEALDACVRFGVPGEVFTFELREALLRLEARARAERIEALVATHEPPGDDLKRSAILAMLTALRLRTARELGRPARNEDVARSVELTTISGDGATWTGLLADSTDLLRTDLAPEKPSHYTPFIVAYGGTCEQFRGGPHDLPFRASVEDTVGAAVADFCERYRLHPGRDESVLLSSGLEATRSPAAETTAPGMEAALARERAGAADWLGRIVAAVGRRRDAFAVIPQAVPGGTIIFCTGPGAGAATFTRADDALARAVADLAHAMRDSLRPERGRADFVALGSRAFDALPAAVQSGIRAHDVLLIAPHYAGGHASIPYELFHDGEGFLGLRKVVTRFPSLAAMVRTLEPPVFPPSPLLRALCVAVPHGVPGRELVFAAGEIAEIRQQLQLPPRGWTVPELPEPQVTPELVLAGLAFGGLAHISAHGAVVAGTPALVLASGRVLTNAAIIAYRFPVAAAVYLNTCLAGATRYLGGGATSGVASALCARGAPCVIASQWEVQDRAATLLGVTFHKHAASAPVGEALRLARAWLDREGHPPAAWAGVELMGDPWHRIDGRAQTADDAATAVLRTFTLDPRLGPRRSKTALEDAGRALAAAPRDPRLEGAITWARRFRNVAPARDPEKTLATAEQLARMAADLNHPAGAALCIEYAAAAASHAGDGERSQRLLSSATEQLSGLARRDPASRKLFADVIGRAERRQKFSGEAGLTPAPAGGSAAGDKVEAVLRAVVDAAREESHREDVMLRGPVAPRLPERSLEDFCWNAFVVGGGGRFADAAADAAATEQVVARAAAAGWISATQVADARRLIWGLLPVLWSDRPHGPLAHDYANGQSGTLRAAIATLADVVDADRAAVDGIARAAAAIGASAETDGSKYARTLARLRGAEAGVGIPALEAAITGTLQDAPVGSVARAYRLAGCLGILLERAHALATAGAASLAATCVERHDHFARNAMNDFFVWKVPGFADVRDSRLPEIESWRYGDQPATGKARTGGAGTRGSPQSPPRARSSSRRPQE